MSVTVDVKDSALQDWLREKVNSGSPEAFRIFQEQGSQIVMEEMRGIVPFKTGFLRESITPILTASGFTVYPAARYAEYVDLGTSPHMIFPSAAKALRFESHFGGIIFAKYVRHPGTRPTFFIRRTAEAVVDKLASLVQTILETVYS